MCLSWANIGASLGGVEAPCWASIKLSLGRSKFWEGSEDSVFISKNFTYCVFRFLEHSKHSKCVLNECMKALCKD